MPPMVAGAGQVLLLLFLAQLLLMRGAQVAVHILAHLVLAVLVGVVTVVKILRKVAQHLRLVQPIQAAVVALERRQAEPLVVQALSFFATPAQFNISLVELLLLLMVIQFIPLLRLEPWLQQRQFRLF